MSAVAEKLITVEEFEKLPDTEMRRELVRGEVVEAMPPGGEHGSLAVTIALLLRHWLRQNNLKGYVAIVSPGKTADEVRDKVHDFFTAGTPLVWVVYPRTQEVTAHTPDGLARTYSAADVLEFDLLAGFRCTVAELFDVP
jgi:Uma2 family endonuclease